MPAVPEESAVPATVAAERLGGREAGRCPQDPHPAPAAAPDRGDRSSSRSTRSTSRGCSSPRRTTTRRRRCSSPRASRWRSSAGATAIAAFPEIRTSSLVVGMSVVMLVVLLAGSLVLGASRAGGRGERGGFVEPAGPAINTLEVDALPELAFQAKRFDVPGGINLIKYVDKGGTHTLRVRRERRPRLPAGGPGGQVRGEGGAEAQRDLRHLLHLPGHRAAGMEADLVIGAAGRPTPSPAPRPRRPPPGREPPRRRSRRGRTTPTRPSQSSTGGT